MNYYERHLGDYAKSAGHLSMLEHGAYTLLLDRYYTTEQPIPADQAHRVCRARSKEERAAVDAVLAEFFTLTDGAWTKGRVQLEITKMQAKVKAAQENGKRGGRPKQTEQKPGGFPAGSESVTQAKAHHAPDTRHQSPDTEAKASAGGTPAGSLCRALKTAGIANVNPGNLRLTTLLQAGATEGEFMAHVAKAADKGDPFAYLLGAVEGERKRALSTAGQLHRGPMLNKQEAIEARVHATAADWVANGTP